MSDWCVLTFRSHFLVYVFCSSKINGDMLCSKVDQVAGEPGDIDCTSESRLIDSCQGSLHLVPPMHPPKHNPRAPAEESDPPTITQFSPLLLMLPDGWRANDSACWQTRALLVVSQRPPSVVTKSWVYRNLSVILTGLHVHMHTATVTTRLWHLIGLLSWSGKMNGWMKIEGVFTFSLF